MAIENPPTYENDEKRAEEMAYAEKPLREGFDKKNLTPKEQQDLNKIANEAGEIAGKEYDTKKKRQSLHGLGDELPYYKKTALHEMEADMAQGMLKADNADQMTEIANSMIATQKSVAEDEKYIKKMSPLEWVNYRVDKIRDEKKFSFAKDEAPDDILKAAVQENLDRTTKILSDKESQILHLTGLIKGEVDSSKNQDFTAVSENAPRLKELELEKAKLEKEVETAKLYIQDTKEAIDRVNTKKEATQTKQETIPGTESDRKESSKPLEENSKGAGDKNTSTKETETKTGSSDSVETKSGKTAKRELPGWLKIFGQMVGGLLLIGWSALFGFLEKQVPGRKGDKK
ncbi:MAG: hypothetical protein WAW33_01450 [Minisyncoccia bacterium]